jgi:hypothetical protein
MELGEQYREWTDVLDIIRKGLNEIKTHPKMKILLCILW